MGEAVKEGLIGRDPLYDLLLVDPDVPADQNLSVLPLTKYFPMPYGGMVARTSWDEGMNANTVVAEMKVVEYNFVNHQHLDAGSFQIYHKGPLAVPSGIYQGATGGYGSDHFNNYYQRSIAHNCMLVYDPGEKMTRGSRELANDGGQRLPNRAIEPATLNVLLNNGYRVGDVLACGFGDDDLKPEYSYLKGDITKAYTDKVKSHKRSFVFLNLNDAQIPAALIVYDHVTASDRNFKKTWLLHSVQEPVFKGNIFEVIRNEKGYDGRLVNTALLPLSENLVMSKVGGKGNEYSVNGVNYPQYFSSERSSGDDVFWRTEISPKQPSETDVFLNVIQVMGASGNTQPLVVEKIEAGTHTGAKFGDRIVLFSKNSTTENQTIQVKIEGKGAFKVLLTDLARGDWKIFSLDKKYNRTSIVADENNLIYFEAPAGNYTIAKKPD